MYFSGKFCSWNHFSIFSYMAWIKAELPKKIISLQAMVEVLLRSNWGSFLIGARFCSDSSKKNGITNSEWGLWNLLQGQTSQTSTKIVNPYTWTGIWLEVLCCPCNAGRRGSMWKIFVAIERVLWLEIEIL